MCAITFVFARPLARTRLPQFLPALLGRAWPAFEIAYVLFVVLILAVFGAAAGAIALGYFRCAPDIGTLCADGRDRTSPLHFGNKSVERVFTWVSILLYGVYAAFRRLRPVSLSATAFRKPSQPQTAWNDGWLSGGLTYAGYNIIGAVVILPVTRHLTSDRDAIVAGITAGPLAMLPALLFFICMCRVRARHCRRSAAFGLPAGAARPAVVPISCSR